MPVAAKQYDTDVDVRTTSAARYPSRRRAVARAGAPAHWNQWESLVEHFGDAAVAEPAIPLPRKRRPAKRQAPQTDSIRITPRHVTRHRPFRLAPTAFLMWSTVTGLLILLLGIHGATLALSQQEVDVAKEIKISREVIDNTNKSIAAIQVSPEMAQWAVANGWHVAEQADFDEVPVQTEAGGLR